MGDMGASDSGQAGLDESEPHAVHARELLVGLVLFAAVCPKAEHEMCLKI